MITGHYVKSVTLGNQTDMYRAIDENRDQSYFLFNTKKEQLNYLRFLWVVCLKMIPERLQKN